MAIAIDQAAWPYHVLLIRGHAVVNEVQGSLPDYAACARRYFGDEQGAAWVEQIRRGS